MIHYLYKNQEIDITGIILVSPSDIAGLVEHKKYQPNHTQLLEQAYSLVKAGRPRELLDGEVWDWYKLSAQTYIGLFETGGRC